MVTKGKIRSKFSNLVLLRRLKDP